MIPDHIIWQVPYRNFVRFLITQGYSLDVINQKLETYTLPPIPEKILAAISSEITNPPGNYGDPLLVHLSKPLKHWAEENQILEMYTNPPELKEAKEMLSNTKIWSYVVGRGFKYGFEPDYLDLIYNDIKETGRDTNIKKEALRLYIRYFCNFPLMDGKSWSYYSQSIQEKIHRDKIQAHLGMGGNDQYVTDYYEGILTAPPVADQITYMQADLSIKYRIVAMEGVSLNILTRLEKIQKMYNATVSASRDIEISQLDARKNLVGWLKEKRTDPDMTGVDEIYSRGYKPIRVLHILDSDNLTDQSGTQEPTDEEE